MIPQAGEASGAGDDVSEHRMAFTEHLSELRLRIKNALIYLGVALLPAWLVSGDALQKLAEPLNEAWQEVAPHAEPIHLNFTNPVDQFMVQFKVAVLVAIFVSSPFLFRELWRFIAPGLYKKEKRIALPFIVLAVLLFLFGGFFAYWFVLPKCYEYFLSFSTTSTSGNLLDGYLIEHVGFLKHALGMHVNVGRVSTPVTPMITVDEYFGLTSKLLLVFGLVFELPLVLSVMAALGIVSAGTLWRFNRYAILLSFVAGAVLTPGDVVVGQVVMGTSLTVLYNISILVALFFGKKRKEEAEAAEAEAAGYLDDGSDDGS